MRRTRVALSLTVLLVLGACTSTSPGGFASEPEPTLTPSPPTSSPRPTVTSLLPRPTATAKPTPSLTPGLPTVSPGGTPVTGEVPAGLLAEIIADAVTRSGVDEAAIVVVRGESVTWSDGSLGCPQPGMNYTQALVPGYWVVLDAAGTEYDYRASARGFFTLCEGGGSTPLPSLDR